MMTFLRRIFRPDVINLTWISLLCLGLSFFYFHGNMLDTGYPDWMYHAFRAQSLQQHGLLSWDNIWDNGISYWRAYQFLPGLITLGASVALHVSVTQAMLWLTVLLFIVFHAAMYAAARTMRQSPLSAVVVAMLSLAFSGYWVLIGFYSGMYAAVCVPFMIMLWRLAQDNSRLRSVFALSIGLSVYVHPLLAISFGGLWLVGVVSNRRHLGWRSVAAELLVMSAAAFFYWYELLFADPTFIAPYQLSKDFLYTVAASLKFGAIFSVVVPLTLACAVFISGKLSPAARYLFWYSFALYLIVVININTPYLGVLDRFQLYRAGFFMGPAFLIAFGEVFALIRRRVPVVVAMALLGLTIGTGITQSLIDSSVYGLTPRQELPDPVGDFLKHASARPVGSIYISDSTTPSYYHPDIRYSNGYNDQLLPQLLNVRLRDLLSKDAPDFTIGPDTISDVSAYVKVLGVQYLFLPQNSPYIEPLQTYGGYHNVATLSNDEYNLVVLAPAWQPAYASVVDGPAAARLQSLPMPATYMPDDPYWQALDSAVSTAAGLKYASSTKLLPVSFLAADQLHLDVPASSTPQHIVLDQSYSRHWSIDHGRIIKLPYNLMLLEVPAGTRSVTLRHTWGYAPFIQAGLGAGVLVWVTLAITRKRRTT